MDEFKNLIGLIAYGLETFGVLVILIGSTVSTIRFLLCLRHSCLTLAYQEYRQTVGRAIILGLEFLIAGDVIRTVIVSHTISSVAVLALIVVIRAFLSFTLAIEIEGNIPLRKQLARKSSQSAENPPGETEQ
ncbi:MAG: DUF1622 domain-containing protein [Pseudomonadota bacterium]